MGATKFTPGPWKVSLTDDTVVVDAARREVAAIDGDYNQPETWPIMEANAKLIAAAPDMYAALDECQRALAMLVSEDSVRSTTSAQAYATAVAAEAKARAALSRATA